MDKDFKKIARGILRNAAQKEPPTDLARVLAYLRIHHERPWHMKQDVWEGLGRPARAGRTRFQGQARRPTATQRWRLAHEIAHHVLHGAEPRRGASWETHELEYEADLLAAELLIPDPWIERAIKKAEKEHHHLDVEELARAFEVGRQEMEKRLTQLGLLKGGHIARM